MEVMDNLLKLKLMEGIDNGIKNGGRNRPTGFGQKPSSTGDPKAEGPNGEVEYSSLSTEDRDRVTELDKQIKKLRSLRTMANLDSDSEEEDLIDEQISTLKQKRASVLPKKEETKESSNGSDSPANPPQVMETKSAPSAPLQSSPAETKSGAVNTAAKKRVGAKDSKQTPATERAPIDSKQIKITESEPIQSSQKTEAKTVPENLSQGAVVEPVLLKTSDAAKETETKMVVGEATPANSRQIDRTNFSPINSSQAAATTPGSTPRCKQMENAEDQFLEDIDVVNAHYEASASKTPLSNGIQRDNNIPENSKPPSSEFQGDEKNTHEDSQSIAISPVMKKQLNDLKELDDGLPLHINIAVGEEDEGISHREKKIMGELGAAGESNTDKNLAKESVSADYTAAPVQSEPSVKGSHVLKKRRNSDVLTKALRKDRSKAIDRLQKVATQYGYGLLDEDDVSPEDDQKNDYSTMSARDKKLSLIAKGYGLRLIVPSPQKAGKDEEIEGTNSLEEEKSISDIIPPQEAKRGKEILASDGLPSGAEISASSDGPHAAKSGEEGGVAASKGLPSQETDEERNISVSDDPPLEKYGKGTKMAACEEEEEILVSDKPPLQNAGNPQKNGKDREKVVAAGNNKGNSDLESSTPSGNANSDGEKAAPGSLPEQEIEVDEEIIVSDSLPHQQTGKHKINGAPSTTPVLKSEEGDGKKKLDRPVSSKQIQEASKAASNDSNTSKPKKVESESAPETLAPPNGESGGFKSITIIEGVREARNEQAAGKEAPAKQLIVEKATTEKVVAEQPAAAEQGIAEKAPAEQAAVEKAAAEQAAAEKAAAEQAAAENAAAEQAAAENAAAENAAAENAAAEQAVAEKAAAEQAVAEKAAAEEAAAEKAAAEQAAAEKAAAEQAAAEKAAAEQAAAEKAAAEQAAAEKAAAEKAVAVIQSCFRARKATKEYTKVVWATIEIQRYMRPWIKAWKEERSHKNMIRGKEITKRMKKTGFSILDEVFNAATLIQKIFRGHFVRILLATVCIQRYARRYLVNKKLRDGTINPPNRKRRKSMYDVMVQSITVIQRAIRKHLFRKRCMQIVGAIKIRSLQAVARGNQYRKILQGKHANAKTIQEWFRALRQRQNYLLAKENIVLVQAFVRCEQLKRKYNRRKKAVLIQAFVRGKLQSKKYNRRKKAVLIQAFVRCELQRKKYNRRINAVKIQAFIRCRLEENKYKYQRNVVRIQAYTRCKFARKQFQRKRDHSIVFQSIWRMHRDSGAYKSKQQATRTLQSFSRVLLAKNNLRQLFCMKAYIRIQSFMRQKLACNVLQRKIRDKEDLRRYIIVQSVWRRQLVKRGREKKTKMATRLQQYFKARKGKLALYRSLHFIRNQKKVMLVQSTFRDYVNRKEIAKEKKRQDAWKSHYRTSFAQLSDKAKSWDLAAAKKRSRRKSLSKAMQDEIVSSGSAWLRSHEHALIGQEKIEKYCAAMKIQAAARMMLCLKRIGAVNLYAKKRSSAIVIQKIARRCLCRIQYKTKYTKIIKAQSFCRMVVAFGYVCKIRLSIKKIQAFLRMVPKRASYGVDQIRIVKIQAFMRMLLDKKAYLDTRHCIFKLQAFGRMVMHRSRFLQAKLSVTKIQAFCRMAYEKSNYKSCLRGVVKIQSFFRFILAKKSFLKIKEESENVAKVYASVKIQSMYRMAVARRSYFEFRRGLIKGQACWRMFRQKSKYKAKVASNKLAKIAAATKMQAIVRGYLAKQLVRKLREQNAEKEEPVKKSKFSDGDRVIASLHHEDGQWFLGVVRREMDDGSFEVYFDDEEVHVVDHIDVQMASFHEEELVEAIYEEGSTVYYPGKVEKEVHTKDNHHYYSVHFNDGDVAVVSTKWMRLPHAEIDNGNNQDNSELKVDTRVEVISEDGEWGGYYPGYITAVEEGDGERLFTVAFDDGEIHEHVKESCVEGVLMEGLKVLAVADEWRSDGSFPGEIYKYNNNGTYVIHFDDGDVHEGIHREDIEVNKNQST
jgi:hypothetical protein